MSGNYEVEHNRHNIDQGKQWDKGPNSLHLVNQPHAASCSKRITLKCLNSSDKRRYMRSSSYSSPLLHTITEYLSITKPAIASLNVFVGLATLLLAVSLNLETALPLILLCVAGFLAAGGAGALNCYVERSLDSGMRRTQHRPLPSHRISDNVCDLHWCGLFDMRCRPCSPLPECTDCLLDRIGSVLVCSRLHVMVETSDKMEYSYRRSRRLLLCARWMGGCYWFH